MLPPPTTMPIWTPSRRTSATCSAMNAQNVGIDAVLAVAEERLAGQLEEDPPVAEPPRSSATGSAAGVAHSSSPSA